MQITDITDDLAKHATKRYTTRQLSVIENLVVHHFAGDALIANVAKYHVNSLGWPGIGYHFCINKDGSIFQTNKLATISYHSGNYNTRSIGIALNGNFQLVNPPQVQQNAARWLINHLRQSSGLNIQRTVGHRELPVQTACPGNTYKAWLPYVVSEMEMDPPAPPAPELVDRVTKIETWLTDNYGYVP
jgi:N-acetylmuramoyl-L-alanine amidase